MNSDGSGQVNLTIPAIVVSQRLGHSSIAVTLNVYTHVTPRMDREAITFPEPATG